MPAFVAMLRGINVAGHNMLKMDRLLSLCHGLGLQSVKTYVQSGNIVFLTTGESSEALSGRINGIVSRTLGSDVPVIVRTSKEMEKVISDNPFLKEKGVDLSKLHVTFFSETVQKSSLEKLDSLATGRDRFYPGHHEIYLYCPDGYGRTKISNVAVEKALSIRATTRNWKTTCTLFEMASKL